VLNSQTSRPYSLPIFWDVEDSEFQMGLERLVSCFVEKPKEAPGATTKQEVLRQRPGSLGLSMEAPFFVFIPSFPIPLG